MILLLTEPLFAPFLRDYLMDKDCGRAVHVAGTLDALRAAVDRAGSRGRLISFLTDVVVPRDILALPGPEPYNIHPGPPEIPGVRPEVFAIADNATEFGVTAHVMAPKVDSGPIVFCRRFPIVGCPGPRALADQAFPLALDAFRHVADHCAFSDAPLARIDAVWSGPLRTRKAFELLRARARRLGRTGGMNDSALHNAPITRALNPKTRRAPA